MALRAGPLTMALQRGKLLHIRCGEREIWHGVAFVFRDADWGTPEPVIEHVELSQEPDGFRVRLEAHFPVLPVIRLHIDIEGSADGRVRFTAEAVPSADILCNRIGLCVMHPMSVQGARVDIEHSDGRLSRSTFPTCIPPWPPFMLIRAIRHEWTLGHWARCELAGDTFEMEDQRNNSDASFKTYSRSNMMPRPYRLQAGVPIRHSANMRVPTPGFSTAPDRPAPVEIRVGDVGGAVGALGSLPMVGIEIAASDADAPEEVQAALRSLQPSHLHLSLGEADDTVNWTGIGALLSAANARLRLDLRVADSSQALAALDALSAALAIAHVVPESIAVFPSDQRSIAAARQAFPASAIGGGSVHFFVQLNRLEGLGDVDFVSFTTSPIVHGADDSAVMLSLLSLPSMVETLHARCPQRPICVGPSTIAMRSSPLGSQPLVDGTRRVALAAQDPRCRGLYGASWTLGYVAQFANAGGVQALTLMSLGGPSGIVQCAPGARLVRHPAYFVLARLGAAARVCSVSVSDPMRVAALALDREGTRELLLANLTGEPVDIHLDGWAASARASILDADCAQQGWPARDTRPMAAALLRLPPYAIGRLETD